MEVNIQKYKAFVKKVYSILLVLMNIFIQLLCIFTLLSLHRFFSETLYRIFYKHTSQALHISPQVTNRFIALNLKVHCHDCGFHFPLKKCIHEITKLNPQPKSVFHQIM